MTFISPIGSLSGTSRSGVRYGPASGQSSARQAEGRFYEGWRGQPLVAVTRYKDLGVGALSFTGWSPQVPSAASMHLIKAAASDALDR